MSKKEPVLYRKEGHVGYITLNRPEDENRLDLAMSQELAEICSRINADGEIYLAVLIGSGEIFCSGGNWQENSLNDSAERYPQCSPAEAVAGINCPTLAVINGDAIGEGLELAMACDIRISSEKAHLGLPQILQGRIPMDGGTQRLSRLVGKGKALELVLIGETIDAVTACEIGLVNKVVSPGNLASEVEALVKSISGEAPLALLYAKEAVNKGLDLTLEQGLRLEADLYFLLHTTADRTEGIQSFLAKRPPQYQGK